MKKFIILSLIFLAAFAAQAENDCNKSVKILTNKYFGSDGSKVKPLIDIKSIPQGVSSDNVVSGKAVCVGKYCFILRGNEWEIYRESGGVYSRFIADKNMNSLKVFSDENIMVKRQPDGVLSIRRNSPVTELQTEVYVKVKESSIAVTNFNGDKYAEVEYLSQGTQATTDKESSNTEMIFRTDDPFGKKIKCYKKPTFKFGEKVKMTPYGQQGSQQDSQQ